MCQRFVSLWCQTPRIQSPNLLIPESTISFLSLRSLSLSLSIFTHTLTHIYNTTRPCTLELATHEVSCLTSYLLFLVLAFPFFGSSCPFPFKYRTSSFLTIHPQPYSLTLATSLSLSLSLSACFCSFSVTSMSMGPNNWQSKRTSLKRKSPESGDSLISNCSSLDDLNEDLFERVLSWLPTSTFFRLSTVCKRWKSAADSVSFKLACSRIPSRDPWFLMVAPNLNQSIIFDSAESSWKRLNNPPPLQEDSNQTCMPVAASSGLICYRESSGNFIVCNPVTGSCRHLPPLHLAQQNQQPLNAIVMSSSISSAYKIVLVFGELPFLSFISYNSNSGRWEDETALRRKVDDSSMEYDSSDDNVVYFLSKAGNVVASNMQRSPTKQYSSVITNKDGDDVIYFLSSSGTVVSCNLTSMCFSEYPRLLPAICEYSIDVVECNGEMLVVLLSEFLESASLRVWRYDEAGRCWHQIAAMPAAMSHEWYGKKADINCVGVKDQIFICLNSPELCTYAVCDLRTKEWIELPKCCIKGHEMEFMSAFSFEPRIEASV